MLTLATLNGQLITPGETIELTTARPTFAGTSSPGAAVTVLIESDPVTLTTTADTQGAWTVTPDEDLPSGEHTVTISATLNGPSTTLDPFFASSGSSRPPERLWGSTRRQEVCSR